MSDIAQRLRDGGNDICRDGPMWPGDDMLEGYAEITRLRALVEELKADRIRINDEAETEITRLRAEVEKLREERAQQDEEWEDADDLRSKLKGLAAENALLRAALDRTAEQALKEKQP